MQPTARLAAYRPLAAEAVTVTHTGAATLFVFAVGTGLCHRDNFSSDATANLLQAIGGVNPTGGKGDFSSIIAPNEERPELRIFPTTAHPHLVYLV
jgi:hypothetical protein